ncbi:MAG: MATE family efflux transporter [Lachnospiraceae bacterium]|nr:MATE family efflux transporter [Lachnospiraceae bacterium]
MKSKSTVRDMTDGSISRHLIAFSIPLLAGNVFQMLYNTVDSIVVGNFVGKEALAAISSTTMIVNIMIFFFSGFSIGGGVVISRYFGAKQMDDLHKTVETTIAVTILFGIFFTFAGFILVPVMLRLMLTPDDVFPQAELYLKIYFSGALGLLIYNMGSGILRAVGDTRRPLYFLIFTSLLNTVLDLVFVIVFKAGIAGAALATILSQFLSAFLVLWLLTKTEDIYKLTWHDLRVDLPILKMIFEIGLPAGLQAMITSVSNTFVQAYINGFGSGCMAGWGAYNKLDSFIFLPINSLSQAATTFVSQNIGAGKKDRANEGAVRAIQLSLIVTAAIATILVVTAPAATSLFTKDAEVIRYGALFIRMNTYFLMFNAVNHVLAGALRGRGQSKIPMYCMLACFVIIRQIYLFIGSRVAYTPYVVGFGYPVGWMTCCAAELILYARLLRKETRYVAPQGNKKTSI